MDFSEELEGGEGFGGEFERGGGEREGFVRGALVVEESGGLG